MVETNFKHTEIGLIPCDWDSRPIESSFSFIGNNTFSRDQLEENGGVYNIHYGDILVKYGAVVDLRKDNVPRIKKDLRTIAKNALQNGDVLMADTAEDEIVGKCCEIAGVEDNQVETGLHTFGLRPKDEYAPSFLGYAFNSSIYHNQLLPHIQGTKVSSISKSAVEKTFLCSPKSLEEQYRIVEALSDMDKLIAALEKKIAKKQAIKQGAMQQLLTGKKRLPYYRKEWIEKKLGEVSEIYRGGSPRPIDKYITTDANGINWVKIGDVAPRSKFINATSEKIIPEGVLLSRRVFAGDFILSNSMSFGRPYILNINGCIHDGWLVIQNYDSTFDRDFLYYCLSSDNVMMQYIAMAAGSSVKNLNKEKVANVSLLFPADISEQKAIASILSSMDDEIEQLQQKLSKYKSLKQGMMQKLLTGQIRLI